MYDLIDLGPKYSKSRPEDRTALETIARESGKRVFDVLVELEAREFIIFVDDCPGCGAPWDARTGEVLVVELKTYRQGNEDDLADHVVEAWLNNKPFNEGRLVLWQKGQSRRCAGCHQV